MEKKTSLITWYITLIGFLGIFSTTISKNPVLPLFVKGMGGTESILGLIAAASPLAGIVFSFPIGFLADKIGKRKLLIISSIIFTVSPLLYLVVSHPLLLVPVRFFHGMATAIMGPVASAIIISFFEKNKAEKLGIYSAATLYGRTLAPLLGGLLISYFAFLGGLINYRLVYVVAFLLASPIILLSLLIPKDPIDQSPSLRIFSVKELIKALTNFLKSGLLTATASVEMATYFIYGVLEAYLPLFLKTKNISPGLIGLLFSAQVISIALTKPFFGRLADKVDKRLQIIAGIFILMVTVSLLTFLSNYYLLLIDVLFFGLGMSLSTVATSTYVAENVAKTQLATSLGILSAIMDIGQSFGPFLTGFVITLFSYHTGFYFSSFIALLSTLYFASQVYKKSSFRII